MRARALSFVFVTAAIAACSSTSGEADDSSGEDALTAEQTDFTVRPFGVCDPSGPCPDLSLDPVALRDSILIETRQIGTDSCSIAEGSITGPREIDGELEPTPLNRRLLRFTTSVTNIGTGSLFLGNPAQGDKTLFEFSACHGHYHFKGYANYQLKRKDGTLAAKGHKESFCVEDNFISKDVKGRPGVNLPERPPERPAGSPPLTGPDTWNPHQRTDCRHPGLHRAWRDAYFVSTEGNWIDITDLDPGDYVLAVTVNPPDATTGKRAIAELKDNFTNNYVEVPVHIPAATTDGVACPPDTQAYFTCVKNNSGLSKCLRGVTTNQTCPTGTICVTPEERVHQGSCQPK
jgi:hypothetical protein